ncbi:MmcQ-like protein [Flavobacterium faecale]|uniref:MmcQ-like protein n=1 Tax=Flavobacterium faecale TaxID=1355330 RepID=A0A2S1L9N7_9FLAO|nr:MmcQ/YjbR family DNA-binding protein [Flavobacterium faecale]AWG20469.1 MmcQ-like protein [Flavobacterium faecale]
MNLERFYDYCLAKKGVTEHFPFDEKTLVFKVGQKMFALSSLQQWEQQQPAVNLKCNPERAQELRAEYESIVPGYHMSKVHWNTVYINQELDDAMVRDLIDHSYELVYGSLSKKIKAEMEVL